MNFKRPSELKKLAVGKLSDCWCECIALFLTELGCLAVAVLSFLLAIQFLYTHGVIAHGIDTVFTQGGIGIYLAAAGVLVLLFVLGIPLKYGKRWYVIQSIRGNNVPASCFFTCYMHKEHYGKIFMLEIRIALRRIAMLLPSAVIGAAIVYLSGKAYKNSGGTGSYTIIIVLLALLFSGMLFLYSYFSMRYFLASYIYALDPKKDVDTIIKESCEAMSGRQRYLNEIVASFAGWIFSCVAIFPAMYVAPYMMVTFTLAASDLIDNYYNEKRCANSEYVTEEENVLV